MDASVSPSKLVLATQNLGSVMQSFLRHGVPVWKNGAYTVENDGRKGFLEILAPLANHSDGSLIPHFELFAAATRAQRLIGEKNQDGTSREKLLGLADIEAGLALGKQYPELRTASISTKSEVEAQPIRVLWLAFHLHIDATFRLCLSS
jgi:hypothetical protein